MKKYFLLSTVIVSLYLNNSTLAQDTIKTQSGEQINSVLLKINQKEVTYQNSNDPELSTYTIPYKEIASVKKQGGKIVYFNHKLPRAFMAISVGPSLPMGDLAKTEFKNTTSEVGFAKTGASFKFDAGFYLYKRWGISISVGKYNNKFDYNKYAEMLGANDSTSSLNVSSTTNTNSNNSPADSKWEFTHSLVGPMYSMKLGRRITWDLKAKAGFVTSKKPGIFYRYYSIDYSSGNPLPATYNIIYHSNSKTAPAYSFGTSFRFDVSNRIAIYIAADYVHTSPTINYDIEKSVNDVITKTTYNGAYKLSSLNVTGGVAFLFKRKGNKYE